MLGGRCKSEVAAHIFDVGGGLRDIAVLHRQQVDLCLATACFLDRVDQFGELFGMIVAEVVQPVRRPETARLPATVTSGRMSERQDPAIDAAIASGYSPARVGVVIN